MCSPGGALVSRNLALALAAAREYASLRARDPGAPELPQIRENIEHWVGYWDHGSRVAEGDRPVLCLPAVIRDTMRGVRS